MFEIIWIYHFFGVGVLKWVVGAKVHQFIGIGNKEEGVKN
jgi:hypothetical protein